MRDRVSQKNASQCLYGGLLCSDLTVYAFSQSGDNALLPPGLQNQVSVVTCANYTTSGCNTSFTGPGVCEDVQGSISGCTIVDTVPAPPSPFSPPPLPPPPPAASVADPTAIATSNAYRAGVYCAPGECPNCIVYNDVNPNKCIYGGMVALDGSLYSFFYAWTQPAGLISGQSLLNCRFSTSPAYCPSNFSNPSYCEPNQGSVTGCFISPSLVQAPNPPPPPPPFPPVERQCNTTSKDFREYLNGTLGAANMYITAQYIAPADLGTDYSIYGVSNSTPACNRATGSGQVIPPCRYGALQCADSTTYAMYYPFTPPSDAVTGSLITCWLEPNPSFCPGYNATAGTYSYCEAVYGSVTSCICTANCAAPPPLPPSPPPLPIFPPPPPSPSPSPSASPPKEESKVGIYVGGAFGFTAAGAALVLAVLLFRRWRENLGDDGAYSVIGGDADPARRGLLDSIAREDGAEGAADVAVTVPPAA